MVKRFYTECRSCKQCNILRVTLGADVRQQHSFECAGCGETSHIRLELDFQNRERFPQLEGTPAAGMSSPSVKETSLDNSDMCDERAGIVTNLDPTFLVPKEMLHQDGVFTWMYAAGQFSTPTVAPVRRAGGTGPIFGDIINEIGFLRHQGDVLSAFLKAWNHESRNRNDLVESSLDLIRGYTGAKVNDTRDALIVVAWSFSGDQVNPVTDEIFAEVQAIQKLNPAEFQRLRDWIANPPYQDMVGKQIDVMAEYSRCYHQFSQTWIYVAKGVEPDAAFQPSTRDIRLVRMFYGTAFEHLASGMALPAALNNIRNGRPFDQFQQMDMKKYLSIDKAGRAKCFEGNPPLTHLAAEFDSTIRNGSHHGGFRIRNGSADIIEYKTGDGGNWKTIRYVDYLLKCNRIFMGLMRLLLIHAAMAGSLR